MRPLAIGIAAILLFACTGNDEPANAARPALPESVSTTEPTRTYDDCLTAYKIHKNAQTARTARTAAYECEPHITVEFHDKLVEAANTIPSPGCKTAYRNWREDRQAPRLARITLKRCQSEIDAEFASKLRNVANTATWTRRTDPEAAWCVTMIQSAEVLYDEEEFDQAALLLATWLEECQ